jgi:hypothetical protein
VTGCRIGGLFSVSVEVEFDFVSAADGSQHTVRMYGEAIEVVPPTCSRRSRAGSPSAGARYASSSPASVARADAQLRATLLGDGTCRATQAAETRAGTQRFLFANDPLDLCVTVTWRRGRGGAVPDVQSRDVWPVPANLPQCGP